MRKPYFMAARWFATPSGQPGPEHDRKNDKEFQESIERGLREAKAGQKIDDVPEDIKHFFGKHERCLLYTSPSPRDLSTSRMPSSA